MKVAFPAFAILVALLIQDGLTLVLPAHARFLDPFLLITIHFALTRGETTGMLIGIAAGWVQDVSFGARILGLIALSRAIIAYGVGVLAHRLLITGALGRAIVVFLATLLDAWIYERLAGMFDLRINVLSFTDTLIRGLVNALVGVTAYQLIERLAQRRVRR
ncbi:MAG: rod shape-determining protein MreD [Vicinamibacteria bacterium]|nr:rod shape-determining protein MreD [Vicinamibacteria bacterium]